MNRTTPAWIASPVAVLVSLAMSTTSSLAAKAPPVSELAALRKAATSDGYVAVQVNLDIDLALLTSGPPSQAVQTRLAQMEDGLKAELSGTVLPSSIWSNGMGQVGVYATQAGLARLEGSNVARSFARDVTREMRRTVPDLAGALNAIEDELRVNGYADVQVLDNLESLEFDLPKSGKSGHRATVAWQAEAARTRPAFVLDAGRHGAIALPPPASTRTTAAQDSEAVLRFRIDWNAYRWLIEHRQVRGLSLLTAGGVGVPVTPNRAPTLDPEALAEAQAVGAASVTIDLHRVLGYTPLKALVPKRAWASQAAAIDRAFDEVLSPIVKNWRDHANIHEGFASLPVTLSADALQA